MILLERFRAYLYRRDRLRWLKIVRRIKTITNDGVLRNSVLTLPGVRGWSTEWGITDIVELIGPNGYRSLGVGVWREKALRDAAAQHIWYMLGKAKQ